MKNLTFHSFEGDGFGLLNM